MFQNAAGHFFADALHLTELVLRGVEDGLHAFEMTDQLGLALGADALDGA